MDIRKGYVGQSVWFEHGMPISRYIGTIVAVYYNSRQYGVAVPGEPFPFILNASQLTPVALQFQPVNPFTSPGQPVWPDDEVTLVSEAPKLAPADDRYPHTCPKCGGSCYIGLQEVEHSPGLDYCEIA